MKKKAKYIFNSFSFCFVFTGLFVLLSFFTGLLPIQYKSFAHAGAGLLAGFITTYLFLLFDRKKFSDIQLTFKRNSILKFFAGMAVGIIIMGLMAVMVLISSNHKIELNPSGSLLSFFASTIVLLPLAFMEELGFRAYPVETLKSTAGIRTSILVTSILFALYHIVNGWSVALSFYGPGVWGIFFGLAAVYSKGIALPTGIHYAANLTTAAFSTEANSKSLWIARSPETLADHHGIDWMTILPSLALLIFSILCLELFLRGKQQTLTLGDA